MRIEWNVSIEDLISSETELGVISLHDILEERDVCL